MGLLEPGDQLPKVRDVAQSLVINPNTVLKAYRQLELEGLAEGRPGVGTFVVRTLAGDSLANQAELREELIAWLRRAHRAGLTDDDVAALVDTTIRATRADKSQEPQPQPQPAVRRVRDSGRT